MRYLNKIIFLNSAHIPYAEVKLDGNVHFIGTQGVGKSTLLRALLFFYNADKLRLGIPKEKKSFDAFYFPYPNSYIVYEVMRENGAYCVLALKNQGRVMFRFIDAPFDSKWFIDERKLVYGEWSQIREQVGKKHDISSLVSSYEMYRDIIFGNNRRQELLPFRKYAIVESAKYQNIPRTIQNVFLNTKLDADFIKNTIIRSMSDEDNSIDLNFYREQIKEFEQEYKDVSLWTKKEKNGEVLIRRIADKVIDAYRTLLNNRRLIGEGRRELNYAERVAQELLQLHLRRLLAIKHFQQLIDGLGMASRLPTDAHGVMHDDDGQDHAHGKNGGVIAVFQTGGHRQCGHGGRVTAGHPAVPCKPLPVDGAVHRQIDEEFQELRRGPGQQRVHQQVVAENIRKHRYTPIM